MKPSRFLPAVAAAALLLSAAPPAFPDGTANPRWGVARGGALPGLSVTAGAPGETSFRHVLPPGEAVAYELPVRWDGSGPLGVSLEADRTNRTSTGYRESRPRFPAQLTVVFGGDSIPRDWRSRAFDRLRRLFTGYPPAGIRLTYATGGTVPTGSMYRIGEEETVFLLGGEEQAGKAVGGTRDVRADFRAAWGREPSGGVTRLLAGGERPSGEEGPCTATVRVVLPPAAFAAP